MVGRLISRVAVASLRDAPLRTILQACYDLYGEGQIADVRPGRLAARRPRGRGPWRPACFLPIDPAPLPEGVRPAPLEDRLAGVLAQLAERDRQDRLRDLKAALEETDATAQPGRVPGPAARILRRLLTQRPDTKKKTAS